MIVKALELEIRATVWMLLQYLMGLVLHYKVPVVIARAARERRARERGNILSWGGGETGRFRENDRSGLLTC